MNRAEWEWNHVPDDLKVKAPSLEEVLYIAGAVRGWEPIFNEQGDNLIGFCGQNHFNFGSGKYVVEIFRQLDSYSITLREAPGYSSPVDDIAKIIRKCMSNPIIARYNSPRAGEFFERAWSDYLKRIKSYFTKLAAEVNKNVREERRFYNG